MTTTETDQVISTLNELIETCKDGQQGFRTAADLVKDASLKSLFDGYSREREQFVTDLQAEVGRLGQKPERTGSTAGALHRGWINIKSMATGASEASIIAEAERGEDSAVRTYQDALNQNLPSQIRSIVQRQYAAAKAAHDRVRDLEKATSKP